MLSDPRSWKGHRAPFQYPMRRLIVRSREVSKPRDWQFQLSHRFEIWQARRQHCCQCACQISERLESSKYKSRGFETSRDLTIRRLIGYWNGARVDGRQSCQHYQHIEAKATLSPFDRRHFQMDCLNENVWISLTISLTFIPKVRPGDKPLSESMMVSLLPYICVTRPQWVKWYKKKVCAER